MLSACVPPSDPPAAHIRARQSICCPSVAGKVREKLISGMVLARPVAFLSFIFYFIIIIICFRGNPTHMPEADLAVRFSKGRGNAESCLRGRGLPCPLIFLAPEPKEQREREALGAGVPSKVVAAAVGKSQEGRKAREHPSRRHFSAEPVFGAPPPQNCTGRCPASFAARRGQTQTPRPASADGVIIIFFFSLSLSFSSLFAPKTHGQHAASPPPRQQPGGEHKEGTSPGCERAVWRRGWGIRALPAQRAGAEAPPAFQPLDYNRQAGVDGFPYRECEGSGREAGAGG